MFFKLIARLPFPVLYIISDIFSAFIYYTGIYRKDIILRDLKNVFPEKPEREIKKLTKACYRNITDLVVETLKASILSPDEIKRRVKIVNPELLDEFIQEKKSMLFLALHHCNWEWLLLAGCLHFPFPIDAIYKKQPNYLNNYLLKIRSRFGAKPVATQQAIFTIMQRRDEFRAYAMVADQAPKEADEKFWVKCFGRDTAFHTGPLMISRMTKLPVFFVKMRRVKRGFYEVTYELLAKPPYEKNNDQLLIDYAKRFEECLRDDPGTWTWNYSRWKCKKSVYAETL